MPAIVGPQGGDTSDGVTLDLSTCVNPYGPPPAVLEALRNIDVDVIKRHPFTASAFTEKVYADKFGVSANELVAARGASELIWQVSRIASEKSVVLPMPTYTEYLKAFPNAEPVVAREFWLTPGQLDRAATTGDLVVFSNPHNPTGRYLSPAELVPIFDSHPKTTFVVDESYADFVEDESLCSVIGYDSTNVIVLRSPTKFFGLGGIRIGVAWTRSERWRRALQSLRTTWPVSQLDAQLVQAALGDTWWQSRSRESLIDDAQWLHRWLSQFADVQVTDGPLHFRLVTGDIATVSQHLAKRNIRARVLDEAHGVGQPALRVSAPRADRRAELD